MWTRAHTYWKQRLPVFVLEFHLPFPTLREYDPLHDKQRTKGRYDVSYLQQHLPRRQNQQYSGNRFIRESHTSIVICGWDNSKWVGWAFVNVPPNTPVQEDEEDDEEEQDDEPLDAEEDYFAADGHGRESTVKFANTPIWDPRRYWLHIVELRVRRIVEEWINLVQFVENGVEAWVSV
jgi:hypothetical protein